MGLWRTIWPARENSVAHPAIRVVEDVRYGDAHPKQALDLAIPEGASGAPVVLFVHGGGWKALDKKLLRPLLGLHTNIGRALARRGFLSVIAGFRQHPSADLGGTLDDLRSQIDWIRRRAAEHGGDPERLVVVGHSAGAHHALVLATSGMPMRGVVVIAGPYDLARFVPKLGARHRRDTPRIFGDDLGRWSPERHLSPTTPPILALFPERDAASLRAEHDGLVAAARAAGARLDEQVVEGVGHMGVVIAMGTTRDPTTDLVAEFVEARTTAASALASE